MLSIKAEIVSSAKAAKRAVTALPRMATRVHPARSSPAASTHSMVPTTKAHEAPAHLAASVAQLEDQVASLEQANADLRTATSKAIYEAQTTKNQVTALTAQVQEAKATHDRLAFQKAQLDRACQVLAKSKTAEARLHEQAMAGLDQRIKDAQALTARRRVDHKDMVVKFVSKRTALANACDRLHRDNVSLEARIKDQEYDLDVQDRHLDTLKRSMQRRQAKVSGQQCQ
ncbi:hypothetical protein H4R35_004502 [Dimargaris xerosporica]|nr:hypothetical protein H4R35_004502 [Dimargaris xerosporica]